MTKEQEAYVNKLKDLYNRMDGSPFVSHIDGRKFNEIEQKLANRYDTSKSVKCSYCQHKYSEHSYGFDGPCGFHDGRNINCEKQCMHFETIDEFESLIKKIRSKKK
jgi:hypothetical protein